MLAGVGDQRQLGRLVVRHEARQRERVVHQRQGAQPRRQRVGLRLVGRQDVDAVRVGQRRAASGRPACASPRWSGPWCAADRQSKVSARQQRRRRARPGAAKPASTGRRARNSKASARSPQAKPTSRASPRGRNSASAAGRKPSVQANAISMPTPAIRPSSATPRKLGRHEGEEARRRWRRRRPGSAARLRAPVARQRRLGRVRVQPHFAKAHAELDGEIHRDADEQDGEGDRNQVQRADRQRGEAGGERQAEPQREQDRHDQPPRPHRQHQPQRHQQQAADHAGHGALGDGGEFLVGERDRAGDAHPRLPGLHPGQRSGGLADGLRGGAARLQRAVVQLRLGQDEAEPAGLLGQVRRPAGFPRTAAGHGRRRHRRGCGGTPPAPG